MPGKTKVRCRRRHMKRSKHYPLSIDWCRFPFSFVGWGCPFSPPSRLYRTCLRLASHAGKRRRRCERNATHKQPQLIQQHDAAQLAKDRKEREREGERKGKAKGHERDRKHSGLQGKLQTSGGKAKRSWRCLRFLAGGVVGNVCVSPVGYRRRENV